MLKIAWISSRDKVVYRRTATCRIGHAHPHTIFRNSVFGDGTFDTCVGSCHTFDVARLVVIARIGIDGWWRRRRRSGFAWRRRTSRGALGWRRTWHDERRGGLGRQWRRRVGWNCCWRDGREGRTQHSSRDGARGRRKFLSDHIACATTEHDQPEQTNERNDPRGRKSTQARTP